MEKLRSTRSGLRDDSVVSSPKGLHINIHKKNDSQMFMYVVSGQISREEERLSAEYRAEFSELTSHASYQKVNPESFSLRWVGDISYHLLTFLLLVISH